MNTIFFSLPVKELLSITAYGEAGGEGASGMMAVLNVIKNRVQERGDYIDQSILASTNSMYHAVILKPYQFSIFNVQDLMRPKIERLAENFSYELSRDFTLQKAFELSDMLLSGTLEDNTSGSTHYHAISVNPSWSKDLDFVGRIGNHLFYSDKSIFKNPVSWGIVILSGIITFFLIRKKKYA